MKVLYLTLAVIFTDQISKFYIKGISIPFLNIKFDGMYLGESISVIGDFFRITFTENPGMAFGFDPGSEFKLFISIFSLVASIALLVYLFSVRNKSLSLKIAIALILGGAIGNVIDRMFYGLIYDYAPLFYGKVVDFFDFNFFNFSIFGRSYDRWPIFNIADAAVSIGVLILLFFYKHHETEDKKLEEVTENTTDSAVVENNDSMNNSTENFNKPSSNKSNKELNAGETDNGKEIWFEVPEGKKKERLDLFLTHSIENATRSKVQKLIDAKLVKVNGVIVKANYQIKPLDVIEAVHPITPRPEDTEPEDIPLDIVYEDDYLLIINKPAGMVAHPAYANYTGTLVNALLHHTKKLSGLNDPGRPGIIHRLDKDTSGLLVVAKDDFTHAKIAEQFSKRTVDREYHTICWGKFKEQKGEIAYNIVRSKKDRKKFTVSENEGRTALTLYEVLEEFDFTSYLKINLKTGRTHQIRVHLSGIGKPVFGDPTYGGRQTNYSSDLPKVKARIQNLLEIMPRQALHAKTVGFFHPHLKKKMFFNSELPEDMKLLIEKLRTGSS